MRERPGHGLDEYLALLNKIPKRVDVDVNGSRSGSDNDADFDRRVRKSMDRQHRRAVIGQS